MVISPNDFSLWSRLTGNKYPSTPRERAQKGPEVQRFIQNLGREGMLEGKQEEEQKKKRSLPEKLATGALIAGGVAAGVAAARDKRVQDVAQRVGSTVRDRTQEFLKNLGPGQEVDVDIVDASGDVTPDPVQQQSNTGPEITVNVSDKYTPIVQGKTYKTEGAISREDPYGDIGNVSKRVDRAYGGLLEGFKNIPGVDVDQRRRQLTRETEKGRDFDIAYMVARSQGRDDTAATQIARAAAGLDTSPAVRPPTEYRKFLGEQKTGSIIKAKIDDLINMVQPGQIARVEGVDQSNLDKYGTWQNNVQVSTNNATPDNKMLKPGAEIGGTTLVDQQATKMAVDNALDNARAKLTGTPVPITNVISTGLKTSIQDDNLRRIEPTNEQLSDIKQEQGEVATDRFGNMMITSPTYDSITGFKPSTESISTNPLEERISRLEGKTAELRAIQENLARAGELLSAGFDPRTTRFDSARAAGFTSKSGIKPRITNPRFQENMNLGKTQEAALPKPAARTYFEQDSEGRIIPATMEQRSGERRVIKGPDTKTITSGGGYQPRGGVGSSIGAYGIEPTDFAQADITKSPTDTGDKQSFSKQPPSANPVESFDTANELRKIQTDQSISPEERRARSKDFLKQKMSERGISAMGESEPLRKR